MKKFFEKPEVYFTTFSEPHRLTTQVAVQLVLLLQTELDKPNGCIAHCG